MNAVAGIRSIGSLVGPVVARLVGGIAALLAEAAAIIRPSLLARLGFAPAAFAAWISGVMVANGHGFVSCGIKRKRRGDGAVPPMEPEQ